MKDNKGYSFEAFQLVLKEHFDVEVEDYPDLLGWIDAVVQAAAESLEEAEQAQKTAEFCEKEYEKLLEENNKLIKENKELKARLGL